MNSEIKDKVSEIIDYITKSSSYQNYLKTKELLSKDEKLNSLIKDIKLYQKQIVNNPLQKEELELKIKNNLKILENNYLYHEYLRYLEEINNMLVIFENKINKYFFDIFN